jgi:hypothetical protein
VSEAGKDALLRQMAKRDMRELGARAYEKVYFNKEQLAKLPVKQRIAAMRLQALMRMLGERSKKRAAEKKAGTP